MRWRVSAWTHPASAQFEPIVHSIPLLAGNFTDPEEPRGRCTFAVPAGTINTETGSFTWRDLIVADPVTPGNNLNSLIRLYRDGVDNTGIPDMEFYLERFQRRILDDGTEVVQLFGRAWKAAGLDAATVRWFDWEPGATQTKQSDWSYGGSDQRNLLTNTEFESDGISEKQQYHVHASAGTYTITVPSFGTTGTIAPYEAGGRASDVETALEAIAGINDVQVTGKGHTQYDPLVIEFLDPLQNIGQITIDETGLTHAGCAHPPCHNAVIATIRNGEFSIEPWTRNQTIDGVITPSIHGGSTLAVIADPNPITSGDQALQVTPSRSNGGAQQVIQGVEPGFASNASVEVYSASTTDEFQLQIKTGNDTWVAGSPITTLAVANTWEEIAINQFVIPDPLPKGAIIWRIVVSSSDGESVPSQFLIRQPWVAYGFGPATIGVISGALIDDAQTDHAPTLIRIPWVTEGAYTDTVDSAAVAWPRAEHLILRRGKHYGTDIYGGQFYELDYVHDLIPGDGLAGRTDPDAANWYLEIFDKDNYGTTHTDLGFVVSMGVDGGLIAGRVSKQTRVLAEGANGIITEAVNAAQESIFGVWESWFGDDDILDAATLLQKAATILNRDLENTIALSVELDASAPIPYADFARGDIASFGAGGYYERHSRRITEIALTMSTGDGGEQDWTPSITASKLFAGEGAKNEGLYRLLTAYNRLPEEKRGAFGDIEAGGRAPTIVVAASNSSVSSQQAAHFVCDGINDEDVIQTAIDLCSVVTGGGGGGRVLLTEGTFRIDTNDVITAGANQSISLVGLGGFATRVETSDTTGAVITANLGTEIRGIYFVGTGFTGPTAITGISASTNTVRVEDCVFQSLGIGIDVTGDDWHIAGNRELNAVNRTVVVNNGKTRTTIVGNNFSVSGALDMGQGQDWLIAGNILGGSVLFEENGSPTGEGCNIVGNYFWEADPWNNSVIEGTSAGASNPGRITITGNQFKSSSEFIIWITDGVSVDITGNTIISGWHSVRLINCTGGTVSNNTIRDDQGNDGEGAIYLSGCSEFTIEDNTISEPQNHGIRLAASSGCLIEGNHIIRPGRALDDTYDGILLDGDSNDNDIWWNKIVGDPGATQPRWAVNVSVATCDDNTYIGNRSGPSANYGRNAAATTTPYNDAGTGTVITLPGAASPQGDNLL